MLRLTKEDITSLNVEAIVNPAHTSLGAGSGLCGVIHAKAGQELTKACIALAPCEEGHSVITGAYNLPQKHIIHTVTPRWWDGGRNEADILTSAYQSILELCKSHGIKSVAVPALATGVHRFPKDIAAQIAFEVFQEHAHQLEVIFSIPDQESFEIYKNNVNALLIP